MDDELLGLLKIIAIGSGVGLLIGVIFRTTFKSGGELFVKGADGLGWGWFLAFGIFMLGLAFYHTLVLKPTQKPAPNSI